MMLYMEAGKTWRQNDGSALIPSGVTMTADEATEYYAKINDINTFVNEAVVKIITGAEPLESFDNITESLSKWNRPLH
jgi:putative aldouronate transport system substrate-binding protein